MHTVTLYTKPGCTLCDEAKDVIEAVRSDIPFALEEVDITTDQTLAGEFGERIPYIFVDGRRAFKFFVDGEALKVQLRQEQPQ